MEKDGKESLLEAGAQLFAIKGFAAVSIRELAQAAGVNSAMISYYFGSKEGLYEAILSNQFSPVELAVKGVLKLNLPPKDRIITYARSVLQMHRERPWIVRFMHSELVNPTPAFSIVILKVIKGVFELLQEAVQDGIAAGDFREDIDPRNAALAIAGMINFYAISRPIRLRIQEDREGDDEQYLIDALNIYFEGVRKK